MKAREEALTFPINFNQYLVSGLKSLKSHLFLENT